MSTTTSEAKETIMCRLGIYGGIEKFADLARALNQLEKSMGGDGNGLWSTEFPEQILKGTKYTTAEIAYDSFDTPGAHVFHTRFATAGGVKSSLNHPFDAGEWKLAHNGHWYNYLSYVWEERSDTQTAARLVAECGPGVLLNKEFAGSGVWIVARPDIIFVVCRGSRSFQFQFLKGGGYFHASERIKNLPVERSYKAKKDAIYAVDPKTGRFELVTFPVAPMPEPVWDDDLDDWDDEPAADDTEIVVELERYQRGEIAAVDADIAAIEEGEYDPDYDDTFFDFLSHTPRTDWDS